MSAAALVDLALPVSDSLDVLPWGDAACVDVVEPGRRVAELTSRVAEAGSWDLVVADVGCLLEGPSDVRQRVASASDRTTLVVRACYLGLRRTSRIRLERHDVVEVVEGGRALRTVDIERVLGCPVMSRLPFDPGIGRAVDAGLLASRLPRPLRRMADDLHARQPRAAEVST